MILEGIDLDEVPFSLFNDDDDHRLDLAYPIFSHQWA